MNQLSCQIESNVLLLSEEIRKYESAKRKRQLPKNANPINRINRYIKSLQPVCSNEKDTKQEIEESPATPEWKLTEIPSFYEWFKSIQGSINKTLQLREVEFKSLYKQIKYDTYNYYRKGLKDRGYTKPDLIWEGSGLCFSGLERHSRSRSGISITQYTKNYIHYQMRRFFLEECLNIIKTNKENEICLEKYQIKVMKKNPQNALSVRDLCSVSKTLLSQSDHITFAMVALHILRIRKCDVSPKTVVMKLLKQKPSTFHNSWKRICNILSVSPAFQEICSAA